MSSSSEGLWQYLKRQSFPRNRGESSSGVRPVRVGPSAPVGTLSGVLSRESTQILVNSGVLDQMQTPSGMLRPVGLICETVNICNADCVFCPYSLQTRQYGTMSQETFEAVCRQYDALGGGPFSLTPMVGDFLLDRELPSRLKMLWRYRYSIVPSVTTNLYALDRLPDDVIAEMLEVFTRIHVSTYGITQEENSEITRRNHFKKYRPQAQRIGSLWERSSGRCDIKVGFRNLHDYPPEVLRDFVLDNFGHDWCLGGTIRYSNWGNTMSGPLPGDAEWSPARENHTTCMLLVASMQVYWDGRVSACACCDYNAGKELALGDIHENNLTDIYNSAVNQLIWKRQESGEMQSICQRCTFHVPLSDLSTKLADKGMWFDFVGG